MKNDVWILGFSFKMDGRLLTVAFLAHSVLSLRFRTEIQDIHQEVHRRRFLPGVLTWGSRALLLAAFSPLGFERLSHSLRGAARIMSMSSPFVYILKRLQDILLLPLSMDRLGRGCTRPPLREGDSTVIYRKGVRKRRFLFLVVGQSIHLRVNTKCVFSAHTSPPAQSRPTDRCLGCMLCSLRGHEETRQLRNNIFHRIWRSADFHFFLFLKLGRVMNGNTCTWNFSE